MKKLALYLFFSCTCIFASAQEQIGIGAMAGITTYLGDFNNSSIISSPDILAGAFVRYAFSDYYGARINAAGGYLSGDPASYSGSLVAVNTNLTPQAFRTFFFTLDTKFEFGFLPYNPFGGRGRLRFSPYFALGAGLLYFKNTPHLQLPLSLGVKYRLVYRWTLGLEWSIAKTFTDDIDGWENVRSPQASSLLNNDWVTHFSINIVYQLFDDRICRDCDH